MTKTDKSLAASVATLADELQALAASVGIELRRSEPAGKVHGYELTLTDPMSGLRAVVFQARAPGDRLEAWPGKVWVRLEGADVERGWSLTALDVLPRLVEARTAADAVRRAEQEESVWADQTRTGWVRVVGDRSVGGRVAGERRADGRLSVDCYLGSGVPVSLVADRADPATVQVVLLVPAADVGAVLAAVSGAGEQVPEELPRAEPRG